MREDAQFSNIEEQLEQNGVYVSTTVGFSMKPMLRNRRDRVVLLPVKDKVLKKWDVPIYHRPDGKYILHRIIAVRDDHYVIRGDNTYAKEYVPKEWVLGIFSEYGYLISGFIASFFCARASSRSGFLTGAFAAVFYPCCILH